MKKVKNLIVQLIFKFDFLIAKLFSLYEGIVARDLRFGKNVIIGRHTYGLTNESVVIAPSKYIPQLTIGNYCSFAPGVKILLNADHIYSLPSTFPFKTLLFKSDNSQTTEYVNQDVVSKGAINIGHDVWIGQNVIILSGTNIGSGAIIGAGSVVTKDVPPYAITVGNPAIVKKYRFTNEIIQKLLLLEWWNLSDETLKELESYLYTSNIEEFIKKLESLNLDQLTGHI